MTEPPEAVVELSGVSVEFRGAAASVRALRDVSLRIAGGTTTALTGPSGAGKSTLLHVSSGLLAPSSGTVRVCGENLAELSDGDRTALRRRRIGFVFQAFHLLPALRAWENVALPAVLDGRRRSEARQRARELLEMVGLTPRANHTPGQLSGGEMQRVAVARALMMAPDVVLADEPTGNLDTASGDEVMAALLSTTRLQGTAVLLVTHDPTRAAAAQRIIAMRDGRIIPGPAEGLT